MRLVSVEELQCIVGGDGPIGATVAPTSTTSGGTTTFTCPAGTTTQTVKIGETVVIACTPEIDQKTVEPLTGKQ